MREINKIVFEKSGSNDKNNITKNIRCRFVLIQTAFLTT